MIPLHYVRCRLALIFAFGVPCFLLLSALLLIGFGLRCGSLFIRLYVSCVCAWVLPVGNAPTVGARTHDHKIKGLALCRLS